MIGLVWGQWRFLPMVLWVQCQVMTRAVALVLPFFQYLCHPVFFFVGRTAMLSALIVAFCLGALVGGIVGVAGNSWWRRYQQRRMARSLLSAIDHGRLGRRG